MEIVLKVQLVFVESKLEFTTQMWLDIISQ